MYKTWHRAAAFALLSGFAGWLAAASPMAFGGAALSPRQPSRALPLTQEQPTSGDDRQLTHVVQPGETLWSIARSFGVSAQRLTTYNGLADPDVLHPGQTLLIPANKSLDGQTVAGAADDPGVVIAAAVTASIPPPALPPSFRWPLAAGGRLSSPFGPRWGRLHAGIDIAVPAGTDILAAAPGVVEAAGWLTGYGRVVIIQHQGGWKTLYAHAQALHVKPGQQVAAGHAIAQVGSSGRATGSHLHFEIHAQGQPLDPLPLLPL